MSDGSPNLIPASPDLQAPFVHAPDSARSIHITTLVVACGPLAAGMILFGWRAAIVAIIAVFTCVFVERLYYRVTHTPALLGRSHAYLTGVLLALTLPPTVPWYVPAIAAAFAIVVGKAIFGGVGHFLWQPALVGRLAVAAMFPALLNPAAWCVLAQDKLLVGDIQRCRQVERLDEWSAAPAPAGADGFATAPPRVILSSLTRGEEPAYSSLATVALPPQPNLLLPASTEPSTQSATAPASMPGALSVSGPAARDGGERPSPPKPPMMLRVPAIGDLICGTWGGGIGETCAVVLLLGGLYLIYRNYVPWTIPVVFLLSAAIVTGLAPIQLQGPNGTAVSGWGPPGDWGHLLPAHWWSLSEWGAFLASWRPPPLLQEGSSVGLVYVSYQVLGGELLLAAFFLATEMTSRPVTAGGQFIFGVGCGAGAMLLRLYTDIAIPAYVAVLAMNTLTPVIDALWRPRVLGTRRLVWLRRKADRSA